MVKSQDAAIERRRSIRLETPIDISYNSPSDTRIHNVTTKNISADGLRFQTHDKGLTEADAIEMKLTIPGAPNPVHAKGAIMWKKKISLEDSSPFDFGVEFIEIEEDNKNTFLKFFCDLLYTISKEPEHANRKR